MTLPAGCNMPLKKAIDVLVDTYLSNHLFANDTNKPELNRTADSVRHLFTHYACVDFAYAANQLTGWPVYHVEFFKNSKQRHAPYHVLLKVSGTGLYFDANGFSTLDEINRRFNGVPEHTEAYPIKPSVFMVTEQAGIDALCAFVISVMKTQNLNACNLAKNDNILSFLL